MRPGGTAKQYGVTLPAWARRVRHGMMKIKKGVFLREYTTFGIGGKAEYFCEAAGKESIIAAVKWAQAKKAPFILIAGASNVLFGDRGFGK